MSTLKKAKKPLPPGTVLDSRFVIHERLGAGAFGAVYRAEQLVFGEPLREVALKLFDSDRVSAANARQVLSDGIILIGLQETEKCPPRVARHMIQVYDVGLVHTETGEQAFMSMELIRGRKTLDDAVRRWRNAGGMPVATALGFLRQILVPLAWMHTLEGGKVHGDLKPDNVLLADDDVLLLADFGLAASSHLGSLGGAIVYQSPENLLGGAAGPAADVYAVGLMWYQMATGRHPFDEAGQQALADDDNHAYVRAQQAARKWPIRPADRTRPPEDDPRIPPASEINKELREHPLLEAMLTRCLAYWQSDRYPNARRLLDDLESYLAGRDLAVPAPPPPPEDGPVEIRKKDAAALLQDARSLLEGSDPRKACALVRQILDKEPRSFAALLLLTRAQAACKEIEEAKKTWALAQAVNAKDPELYDVLVAVYEAAGNQGLATAMRQQAERMRQQARGKG